MADIFGLYDHLGWSNLFTAQGNALYQLANVQDEISSPAHNAKYDPTPDNPDLPVPTKTSIADFLGTSQDPLGLGGTYTTNISSGITNYAAYRGYDFHVSKKITLLQLQLQSGPRFAAKSLLTGQ